MSAQPEAFDSQHESLPSPAEEFCTEDQVVQLVHAFYARIRSDPVLGPIFDAHIQDWDRHLAKLVDFWSSALRGTARYRGAPMPAHAALPGLTPCLFHRWLALFRDTTQDLGHPALQQRADELAHRIAGSLWHGYTKRNEFGRRDGRDVLRA